MLNLMSNGVMFKISSISVGYGISEIVLVELSLPYTLGKRTDATFKELIESVELYLFNIIILIIGELIIERCLFGKLILSIRPICRH